MRSDMHKVIVERPRRRGLGKPAGRIPRELEALPTKESLRRRYGYYGKEFNEHLGPLRRFLAQQVGRPWNNVYRDICKGLRAGHPVHDHVRLHVFDYVALESLRDHDRAKKRWTMFYVDARTGILRASARKRVRG